MVESRDKIMSEEGRNQDYFFIDSNQNFRITSNYQKEPNNILVAYLGKMRQLLNLFH